MTKVKQRRDELKTEEDEAFFKSGTLRELGPLLIFLLSTILFWGSWRIFMMGQSLIVEVILKFVIYLSVILWLNSALYMRELAIGTDVDTLKFQKKQVKFTLWIFSMFILTEIPTWIYVFLSH